MKNEKGMKIIQNYQDPVFNYFHTKLWKHKNDIQYHCAAPPPTQLHGDCVICADDWWVDDVCWVDNMWWLDDMWWVDDMRWLGDMWWVDDIGWHAMNGAGGSFWMRGEMLYWMWYVQYIVFIYIYIYYYNYIISISFHSLITRHPLITCHPVTTRHPRITCHPLIP